MNSRIGASFALSLATVFLAGCASQTSDTWVDDVCNIHASWVSSGRPQADEQRLTNSLKNAIPADGLGAVAESARAFVDAVVAGDRAMVESPDEEIVAACAQAGWEPPEG